MAVLAMVFGALAVGIGLTDCANASADSVVGGRSVAVLATGFAHPGDVWAGEQFFCLRKPVDHVTPGIAHRTKPCGALAKIRNRRTGLVTYARVIDRGPYWLVRIGCARDFRDRGGFRFASHACWARGRPATRHERRHGPRNGWTWANHADLTPPVRRAIRHNGKEPIDLEWVR